MVTPPRSEPAAGPRDEPVADILQRLARARTQLVLAERAVDRPRVPGASPEATELVESARVDLLWATASAILAPDNDRSRRRLVDARSRLADLLERLGYQSYAEFTAEHPPVVHDDDPDIQAARDEFEAAAAAWEEVQGRLLDADCTVIDLRGDESA